MTAFTTRQQEIINATIKLIHEGGIQRLTMKNLSKRLGISEPALYRHFENKMAILLAMLQQFKERSGNHLARARALEGSSLEQLGTIFLEHSGQFATNPHMAAVVFSEEAFQDDSRLSELVFSVMDRAHKTISEIIGEGQMQGTIRSDLRQDHGALLILGSLRLMVRRWRLSNYAFDLKQESQQVWQSLSTLLRNP
ncbi:hypothetical protein CSA56_14810 [candidate division KSB3 bacterium]|uniref:HTH tetR-type domain-containing protein n=1 Tax=candidate division KSB3 bacterium TaxID=2044937 RepID=A0A2G6KA83_9BACT|nr:MAG: hypothetical protein CSA56_14810 [candidate division KSB3 bacterium]